MLSQLPLHSDSTRHFSADAVPVTTPFGLYSPLFQLVLSQLPLYLDSTRHFSSWCCPSCHSIRTLSPSINTDTVRITIRFGLYSPLLPLVLFEFSGPRFFTVNWWKKTEQRDDSAELILKLETER